MARVAALFATAAFAQEQVHISLTGDATTMAVDFVVPPSDSAVTVSWGASASAPADCKLDTLNTYKAQWCTALLTGLAPNTEYSYTISTSAKTPFTANFTNMPARATR